MGVQNGKLPNNRMTASSHWDKYHAAFRGRLFLKKSGRYIGAWRPRTNNRYQFLQVWSYGRLDQHLSFKKYFWFCSKRLTPRRKLISLNFILKFFLGSLAAGAQVGELCTKRQSNSERFSLDGVFCVPCRLILDAQLWLLELQHKEDKMPGNGSGAITSDPH